MIQAICETLADARFHGQAFKGGNTTVCQTSSSVLHTPGFNRQIEIRFHGTIIATIEPALRLTVNSGGYRTATTKSRLNAILDKFTHGFYIVQKSHVWQIWKGGYYYHDFKDGDTFTLTVNS